MAPYPQEDPTHLGPGSDLLRAANLQSLAQDIHNSVPPTRTLKRLADALSKRQSGATATVTVVSSGSDNSSSGSHLSGGAIAGIVIGSIAGFLLLWWIVYSCTNLGAPPRGGGPPQAGPGGAWYDDEYGPRRSRSRSHRSRSRSHRSRSRSQRPVTIVAGDPRPPAYVYERDSRDVRRGRKHRSRSRY